MITVCNFASCLFLLFTRRDKATFSVTVLQSRVLWSNFVTCIRLWISAVGIVFEKFYRKSRYLSLVLCRHIFAILVSLIVNRYGVSSAAASLIIANCRLLLLSRDAVVVCGFCFRLLLSSSSQFLAKPGVDCYSVFHILTQFIVAHLPWRTCLDPVYRAAAVTYMDSMSYGGELCRSYDAGDSLDVTSLGGDLSSNEIEDDDGGDDDDDSNSHKPPLRYWW